MIESSMLYSLGGLALFTIGLFGLLACSHPLRKILAVNIMSSGIFLLLVATAYFSGVRPIDPVPQAMVLTGIVISVSTTGLALILACRVQETKNLSMLGAGQREKTAEGDRS
jgi:multicomponent Na+:H+ antiporter subunit C